MEPRNEVSLYWRNSPPSKNAPLQTVQYSYSMSRRSTSFSRVIGTLQFGQLIFAAGGCGASGAGAGAVSITSDPGRSFSRRCSITSNHNPPQAVQRSTVISSNVTGAIAARHFGHASGFVPSGDDSLMPDSIHCDARGCNGYLAPLMWPHDPSPMLRHVLVVYLAVSVVTLLAYGVDKALAGGRRRIPENALHLLALAGGWPGAMLAMTVFRHKRRQASFVVIVWLIAIAHAVGWAWLWADHP